VPDKSTQLLLTALGHAAASGAVPLHPTRAAPGLFPASALGKQVAQRCQEEGYLRSLAEDELHRYQITDKGLQHLLEEMDPRQVIEDFVRVLERRQTEVDELLRLAREMHLGLETLRANTQRVLRQLERSDPTRLTSAPDNKPGQLHTLFQHFLSQLHHAPAGGEGNQDQEEFTASILERLIRYQEHAAQDCPLPVLYEQVQAGSEITIGQFHDALRRLHETGAVYLHPWTGPLYEIPDPSFALLVGHEIVYYVSLRRDEG
jgi:hypothetical protein